MNNIEIENALKNSKASVELEGLTVSEESNDFCRRLLKGDITDEEAMALIMTLYDIKIKKEI